MASLVSVVGGELVTFTMEEVGWWIEKRKRKSISVSLWNKHDKLPSFFFFLLQGDKSNSNAVWELEVYM